MEWLTPDWPVANNIRALTTLKRGGYSRGAYQGLNLATHVGDEPAAVHINRRLLASNLNLPTEPRWLTQVHGTTVAYAHELSHAATEADAVVSHTAGEVCAILTADCLPVLLCNTTGTRIGAVHAGWRGLAAGVIEAAVKQLQCSADTLMAWLGPAIGPDVFEVGKEVVDAFQKKHKHANKAFKKTSTNKWHADIYELAKIRLQDLGITKIYGGDHCTYSEDRFYSARRSSHKHSAPTGRMATLIWRMS